MNIFKLISNWIIKKLGGYTEEEYGYVCRNWMDRRVEVAELEEKYNTEHENYLAMLNLYNTTVEQMQNNAMGVSGAIDTIKAYCKSKGSCDECALYNKNSGCKIHEIPCYWGE